LSDGTLLPTGTLTFSPSNAIASDSTIYPNADTFDGLRFYNLREASAEDGNKYQLTSISSTQMFFGAGRHACPGRWFASHEIKLVIASLMSRYEFRLKGGEERPKSILFQHGDGPDPKAEILFLSRKA
jgi:cytochrome P450